MPDAEPARAALLATPTTKFGVLQADRKDTVCLRLVGRINGDFCQL